MRLALVAVAALLVVHGAALAGEGRGDGAAPVGSATEFPELRTLRNAKQGVIIVVDRSGSMAINDRFEVAIGLADRIVDSLPPATPFGVYAFDARATSLFNSNTLKATDPLRRKLRSKLEGLGVNRAGGTDLVAALTPALRSRAAAIYLLTDGVQTTGPEPHRVEKALRDLEKSVGVVPIHVIGVFGGSCEWGDPEDPDSARALLRAIVSLSGGTYREVEAKPHAAPGSVLKKDEAPSLNTVTFRLSHDGEELGEKLTDARFDVEIRDPVFAKGLVVLEYANVRIDVRTRTRTGAQCAELTDVKFKVQNGSILSIESVETYRGAKQGEGRLKLPEEGGTLEVVYHRGAKTWKKELSVVSSRSELVPGAAGK